MFGIFLAMFLAAILFIIVSLVQEPEDKNPVIKVLMFGYFLRLFIRMFNRYLVIFSDGQTLGGGDAYAYEERAETILQIWNLSHVHFVTTSEAPEMSHVPLPPNLFALINYINGEYTALGCVSVIAFLACLTVFFLYRTYIAHDLERKISFYIMTTLCFLFSFLTLTSDLFKDGMIVFFVVSIVSILIKINSANVYLYVSLLLLCFWGLDGTRYYIAYALIPATFIRFLGFQKKKIFGFWTMSIITLTLCFVGLNMTMVYSELDVAEDTLENSYNEASQLSNLDSGSGVDIDGGVPTLGSLPLKIFYVLFAPFPWQGGSFGLQISKIEMIFWYFILYWAYRGFRFFLKRDPMMILMLFSFLIGMTVVYAWSFTNIGLIYRQRLPIYFVSSILSVWGYFLSNKKSGEKTV